MSDSQTVGISDLFGHPLSTHGLDGSVRSRMLYAAGDACPSRSDARAEFYRAAAQAQRESDAKQAATQLKEDRRLSHLAATRARFSRKAKEATS